MKSTVETTGDGLRIEAAVAADKQAALLEELGKCAAGRCSCPTPQYAKLAAIRVATSEQGVTVDLTVKSGEAVDVADIEACLAHTAREVGA